jgi:hypothetical protein
MPVSATAMAVTNARRAASANSSRRRCAESDVLSFAAVKAAMAAAPPTESARSHAWGESKSTASEYPAARFVLPYPCCVRRRTARRRTKPPARMPIAPARAYSRPRNQGGTSSTPLSSATQGRRRAERGQSTIGLWEGRPRPRQEARQRRSHFPVGGQPFCPKWSVLLGEFGEIGFRPSGSLGRDTRAALPEASGNILERSRTQRSSFLAPLHGVSHRRYPSWLRRRVR